MLVDLVAENSATGIAETTGAHAEFLAERRDQTSAAIREVWGDALDLYDVVREAAYDLGSEVNTRDREAAAEADSFAFDVLANLHARACRISDEVGSLLRSGHGTGALSLWRSIHELTVVAKLVNEHGDELARRYLDHGAVSSYDDQLEYNKHADALCVDPIEDDELNEAKRRRDAATKRNDEGFEKPFGWAKNLPGRSNWKTLEGLARLNHLRPFYSLASHGIHATPRGGDLSYIVLNDGTPALAAGPTTAGLAEPASAAALSFTEITTVFVTNSFVREPDLSRIAAAKALHRLREILDEQLAQAHRAHERRLEAAAETRR